MKNSYRIITKFSYKNKQYFIILSNENKIAYVVYENKKVITDIDKQDLNILNFVYNSLKIDKDSSIELGTKELYGKKFEFFYDINKKLYYWCEIINNKRKLADEEDNQKLNFRYNNMPIVLYNNQESENSENQENNKKKSFINRLLTYKDRTLLVLVAAGISLNLISRCSFAKDEYNPRQEGMQSSFGITEQYELDLFKKKEKFDYGKIQKAIEDNQNLSNGEKEIINKLKFVFDENYEYMDLDLIIKRLSDLKIEYIEEENENSQVTAAYYINKNVIQIYKATDLENADLTDLVHEILHVFQASNTNRLTLELSNELTTREVLRRLNEEGLIEENYQFLNSINEYSNYGKGYEPCIRAEYLLANILPRDVIKAYQFKPEDAILLAALLNITEESEQKESKQDSLNRACDLLDSIDELVTYDESGNTTRPALSYPSCNASGAKRSIASVISLIFMVRKATVRKTRITPYVRAPPSCGVRAAGPATVPREPLPPAQPAPVPLRARRNRLRSPVRHSPSTRCAPQRAARGSTATAPAAPYRAPRPAYRLPSTPAGRRRASSRAP